MGCPLLCLVQTHKTLYSHFIRTLKTSLIPVDGEVILSKWGNFPNQNVNEQTL